MHALSITSAYDLWSMHAIRHRTSASRTRFLSRNNSPLRDGRQGGMTVWITPFPRASSSCPFFSSSIVKLNPPPSKLISNSGRSRAWNWLYQAENAEDHPGRCSQGAWSTRKGSGLRESLSVHFIGLRPPATGSVHGGGYESGVGVKLAMGTDVYSPTHSFLSALRVHMQHLHSFDVLRASNSGTFGTTVILRIHFKGGIHPLFYFGISHGNPEGMSQHLRTRTRTRCESTYLMTCGVCAKSKGGSVRSLRRCFRVSVFNQSLS